MRSSAAPCVAAWSKAAAGGSRPGRADKSVDAVFMNRINSLKFFVFYHGVITRHKHSLRCGVFRHLPVV